jgi:dGTPase
MAIDAGRERAPYACHPRASRGRQVTEPESAARNVFRRDCDRVIHSAAFRRLKHKTQVFVVHEGDHYRTRLTHTLEVTQIARSLARALGLDEDLAEALALAHDLGHPPFGHVGEEALAECLADHGGFDHNVQTLRVVTALERRYAAFDGLNLTWETLDGLLKHNGPLTDREGAALGRYRASGLPEPMRRLASERGMTLWTHTSAEGQAAAIADDIAYDAHDLDDGLRAELFGFDDLAAVPLLAAILDDLAREYPALEPARRAHELVRRLITVMIGDVVTASQARLAERAPGSPDAVREAGTALIAFSAGMAEADRAIKAFLFPRMYRHRRVQGVMAQARRVVLDLFAHYSASPGDLPADWRRGLDEASDASRARRIGDFIAGMTDNYALAEHARFFDSTPELR